MAATQTVAASRRDVSLTYLLYGFFSFMGGISIAYSALLVPTFGCPDVRSCAARGDVVEYRHGKNEPRILVCLQDAT